MNIEISARHIHLKNWLSEYIQRRLQFCLDRFPRIGEVRVQITDVNGPRRGQDTRCRIQIDIPRHGQLMVEQTGSDILSAVTQAAHRLKNLMSRTARKDQYPRRTRRWLHAQAEESLVMAE